jgi:hypothetical protein
MASSEDLSLDRHADAPTRRQRFVLLASKSKARKLSQENTLVHGIGFPRFEKPPGYVLQWSERLFTEVGHTPG